MKFLQVKEVSREIYIHKEYTFCRVRKIKEKVGEGKNIIAHQQTSSFLNEKEPLGLVQCQTRARGQFVSPRFPVNVKGLVLGMDPNQ